MKIKSIGEFGLIEKIRKAAPRLKNAVLGIGDDCAVINYTKDKYLLLTLDMLIENVHFDLRKFGAYKTGRKALAVSLSDIAAMGGAPKYCLVSLGIPQDMPLSAIDDFYAGLAGLAKEYGVELIGGDTNRAQDFICDVCVAGEVEKRFLKTRGGARVGDKIYVTGFLGGSITGRQYDFTPRVKEARALVKNFDVSSMIDISDGLSSDLLHITESSGVGALIYEAKIPVAESGRSVKAALSDGEDFELLFTMPRRTQEEALSKKLGVKVSVIGEIVGRKKSVKIVGKEGVPRPLKPSGYAHF